MNALPQQLSVPPARQRSRWAAIGAAIAVTVGSGGLFTASASTSSGERGVFVPIAPCRLLDTRPAPDNVGSRSTPVGPGETLVAPVRGTNGNCTIPADAIGIEANVAIVNPTTSSFLTAFPSDAPRPLAANLNWVAHQAPTPNSVTARLSADGKVAFYNLAGTVDLAVDIDGYFVDHNHDDRYYTKTDSDGRYYTKTQLESGPANISLIGRMSTSQARTGQWWLDTGRDLVVPTGTQVGAIASDGAHIWATRTASGDVIEVDPVTGTIVHTITGLQVPIGIAIDPAGSIWVAENGAARIARIDPASATITGHVSVGANPRRLISDGTSLWTTLYNASGSVVRVDPATSTAGTPIDVGGSFPDQLVFDGHAVWVANASPSLTKVDIATLIPTNVPVSARPSGLTFDGTFIWVLEGGTSLRSINAVTNLVGSASAGLSGADGSSSVGAFDGHRIWIAGSQSIFVVDRHTVHLDQAIYSASPGEWAITFDGTSIWVADPGGFLRKMTP